MSRFWSLEPEVAGELGDGSMLDTSVHPPRVLYLQYSFSGWLGDDLLEGFPCYIATDALAGAIRSERFTGVQLMPVDVVASDGFREMYPGRKLPGFTRIEVRGEAGVDDFGLSDEHVLVVSDAVFRVLRKYTLAQCDVDEYIR